MNSELASDRWSFQSWFSGFGNADYIQFKKELAADIENASERQQKNVVSLICDFENLMDRAEHLTQFLHCLQADDATNVPIKMENAAAASLMAEVAKLKAALQIKLAALDDSSFQVVLGNQLLDDASYAVRRLREEGSHTMDMELESLALDLNIDGLHAWGRLYQNLSSSMKFPMTFPDGHTEIIPMARRRALMADPDRNIRQSAFEEGQKPWIEHAETLSACLNAIAGTRFSLYRKRKINHFLDEALFENNLTRATLDAMLQAVQQNIELPRRALRAAAKLQGTSALHYFDLEAPQIMAPQEKALSWTEACSLVGEAFDVQYPKLGDYFRSLLQNNWIEAEARANKSPGAFCTYSRLKREERVFMSFYGTLHDVVTLAHECGHAWHSYLLRPKRSLSARYPMTLAETASNFGEMLLLHNLMENNQISEESKAYIIDQQMLRCLAYLVNIPMRFHFENAFYTERMKHELSVARLGELMKEAQLTWYGDTLLSDGLDPLFWASKMHFFLTELSFYNFPYLFGYLLSLAIFERFKKEGAPFLKSYEAFLENSGSSSCEEVARKTLGFDLTDVNFWSAAMQSLEPIVKSYESLAYEKRT